MKNSNYPYEINGKMRGPVVAIKMGPNVTICLSRKTDGLPWDKLSNYNVTVMKVLLHLSIVLVLLFFSI